MLYILFDTLTLSLTSIFLASYIFFLHDMKKQDFIISILTIFLLNNNLMLTISFIFIFLLDKIIFKYIKYNLYSCLITYIIFYLIIGELNRSLIINIIFVIILYNYKYINSGDELEFKEISN